MENNIAEVIENIIGDTPVSVQIAMALDKMAEKEHEHHEYALRDDVEDLKRKIDMPIGLVGDRPVSDQICSAINRA